MIITPDIAATLPAITARDIDSPIHIHAITPATNGDIA